MKLKRMLILFMTIFILCGCGKEVKEYQMYCEKGNYIDGKCRYKETIVPEYTCEEGFSFNEETKRCEGIISIDASKQYGCDDNYELKSGKCISEKTYPKNDNGTCLEGTLYNGECKDIKYKKWVYSCPSALGTLNNETHKCDLVDARKPEFTCEEGYTINETNNTCEKYIYEDTKLKEVE